MDSLTIGRASNNDLVIDDPMASRYHARLFKNSGHWYLADLQSTHGTRINGLVVVDPTIIKPADQITISNTSLTFDGEAFYSTQGRKLLSLKSSSSKDVEIYSAGFSSADQLPALNSTRSSGRFNLLVFVSLTAVFVLFMFALFAILKKDNSIQMTADQPVLIEQQRELTIHSTITHDGGEYAGMLLNGLPHGHGKITYTTEKVTGSPYDIMSDLRSSVKVYEGEWQNGRKHGYGKMINSDGTISEGFWEYDRFIGQGGN